VGNVLVENRLRKRRINLGSFGSKNPENCSSPCKSVKLSGSRNSTRNFFWKHAYGQEKEKLGGVAQTACESIDFPRRYVYRGRCGGPTAVNVAVLQNGICEPGNRKFSSASTCKKYRRTIDSGTASNRKIMKNMTYRVLDPGFTMHA
jgi:hypothetical protein